MLSTFVTRHRPRPLLLPLLLFVGLGARPGLVAVASDPAAVEPFETKLAAGDFSAALQLADQMPSGSPRDQRLAQLAEAQSRSGERSAALWTLARVTDDRVRRATLDQSFKPTQETAARSTGNSGGAQVNFDDLIDLIQNTVKPLSWEDTGGNGRISPFRNGVLVDASGVLRRITPEQTSRQLAETRRAQARSLARMDGDARKGSALRKVSLPKLEKYVQLCMAAGRRPTDEMLHLAGLEKIRYVLVYPETGDLVLAGPASDWRIDAEGRPISLATGRPTLQLDDLVVLLRTLTPKPQAVFGCSINPTEEGLARTKQFAEQSQARPLKPGERGPWLKQLRAQMGRQTIVVDGVDPRTRVARVMVEADYRMKLIGMGLERGTPEVPSYLNMVSLGRGQAPPPLDVLRWWFTANYDAVRTTPDRDAFELCGQGVKVLSENELLTQLGKRVPTGDANPTNREFAARFTSHFPELAAKYPIYADLQNVFDLAMVAALIGSEQLAEKAQWHLTCFGDSAAYPVTLGTAPQSVETIINHRVVQQRQIVVGVSGGVHVEPGKFIQPGAIVTDEYGAVRAARAHATAEELPLSAWWWD